MSDLYLKFTDEAQAVSYLYGKRLDTYFPVEVSDEALIVVLDGLPLRDAQFDQVVEHEKKLYMADAGKWFELTDVIIGNYPNFANIDTIGVIYENQPIPDPENPPEPVPMEGWHVNVRLIGEDGSALEPFKVEPEHPRRVWG